MAEVVKRRDPKGEPRPGDVLRGRYLDGKSCRRTVKSVTPLGNLFVQERGFGEKIIGPYEWSQWAKDAEIIRVAE